MSKKKIAIQYLSDTWYLPTNEDWLPNCERNTAQVIIYAKPDKVRISVVGANCQGLAIVFPTTSWEEAQKLYNEKLLWAKYGLPNPITKDWLLKHEFQFD